MNRHNRRAAAKSQHQHVAEFPERLTPIPRDQFPPMSRLPDQAWKSRKYLIQLYREDNAAYPGLIRLSICRVKVQSGGGWEDALTWDELQAIKREVGFGDRFAVEIYPPDTNVVNVANMRHLWVFAEPLAFGWMKGR